MQPFSKVHTSNTDLNRVQENVEKTLNPIVKLPLMDSQILEAVTLTSGVNYVSHGLGRNYRGCFVGLPTAAVSLSFGTSPDRSQFIAITASGPTTVPLLVY